MAKVAVILTVHDVKYSFVQACVCSIKVSEYRDWHIYLVDDCSTKENYESLKHWMEITYIRNETNLGLCRSVQKAFDIARQDGCEYIVRIGSDDVIATTLLKEESEFLDSYPEYVAVCCDLQKFGLSEVRINRPTHWVKKHHTNYELLKSYHGYGYAGGLMFRASALDKCRINPEYPICEDFDFHLQLLDVGKIKSINRALYLYRSHENNLCKKIDRPYKNDLLMKIIKSHNLDKCTT